MSGDTHDFRVVNDFAKDTSWLHGPARLYANDGVVLFGLLLVAGVLLARRKDLLVMARALLAGAGVLIAVALNQPIVHAVDEPRPYTQLKDVLVLVHRSVDASFPSDHATMAGAAAVGLLFVHRRLGIVATLLAALMAADRVYVGAHFPIDVLAGLAVGGVVALGLQALARPLAMLLGRLGAGRLIVD
ncbi:MAG: Undecaprenyl-diphosphatase [Frankiales bacterium]|nr:Undecaprenyl-diphosphatase [Frankiales bacterium]